MINLGRGTFSFIIMPTEDKILSLAALNPEVRIQHIKQILGQQDQTIFQGLHLGAQQLTWWVLGRTMALPPSSVTPDKLPNPDLQCPKQGTAERENPSLAEGEILLLTLNPGGGCC